MIAKSHDLVVHAVLSSQTCGGFRVCFNKPFQHADVHSSGLSLAGDDDRRKLVVITYEDKSVRESAVDEGLVGEEGLVEKLEVR